MNKYLILFLLCMTMYYTKLNAPVVSRITEEEFDKIVFEKLGEFAKILELVKREHYDPRKIKEAMTGAMNSCLNILDKHSGCLNEEKYKAMQETSNGEFGGIGIVVSIKDKEDKHLTIIDIIPGGPANLAGVEALDKIIEINGKLLQNKTTNEVTKMLKGPPRSTVNIKILREGKHDLISKTIKRDIIKEQNAFSFYIPDKEIYYIKLNMFTENSVKQIKNILNKLNKEKSKAFILDLRNNSGGLLSAVIDIAGYFLKKGNLIVVTKDKNNKVTDRYVTNQQPIVNNKTAIFIITNNYTASAAEILAGILKYYSMAYIVGTTTFGKASVQKVIPIVKNAIKLTGALYFFPDGTTPQGIGIMPDIPIEHTLPPTKQIQWFIKNYGRENSGKNHIRANINNGSKKKISTVKKDKKTIQSWEKRAKEMLNNDNQLRTTIILSQLLDMAKRTCPDKVCNRKKTIEFMRSFIANKKLNIVQIKG